MFTHILHSGGFVEKQDLSAIKSQVSTDGGLGERIKLGSFLGGGCRRGFPRKPSEFAELVGGKE